MGKVQVRLMWVRRLITSGLTGIAFFNSYRHTAQWFGDQGQDQAQYALALIPELGVILVVLILAGQGISKAQRLIALAFGFGSLGLTIMANLASAGPGAQGIIAALVALIAAVLGFALEVVSLRAEPLSPEPVEPPAVVEPEPLILVVDEPEPVILPEPPVVEPLIPEPVEPPAVVIPKAQKKVSPGRGSGLVDQGIIWAQAQQDETGSWPTNAEIRAQFAGLSPASVKRVRAAGTRGTADLQTV